MVNTLRHDSLYYCLPWLHNLLRRAFQERMPFLCRATSVSNNFFALFLDPIVYDQRDDLHFFVPGFPSLGIRQVIVRSHEMDHCGGGGGGGGGGNMTHWGPHS